MACLRPLLKEPMRRPSPFSAKDCRVPASWPSCDDASMDVTPANPVREEDHVRLTHVPGVGLGVRVNDQPGLVIRGVGFSRAAWGTYLGRNHLGVALKEGLTSRLR